MPAAATATPVFDRLQPRERASVLDVLLRRRRELRAEAGHLLGLLDGP